MMELTGFGAGERIRYERGPFRDRPPALATLTENRMKVFAHVRLETLTPLHVDDVFSVWSDLETVRFTNWSLLPTREECAQRIGRLLIRYGPGSLRMGPFVIRLKDGGFAGLVGVDVGEPFTGEHEVWYLLKRDCWGRGVGTLSVSEVLKVMTASSEVTKAVASAVADNIASWRILEKNGFIRSGVVPGGFRRNGFKLDICCYEKDLRT